MGLAKRGEIQKLAGPATMTSRAYRREGERVKRVGKRRGRVKRRDLPQ